MIQDNLTFCLLTPLICGFASAFDTRSAVKSKWYQNVKKPWFNPPRYVFAPIWIYLYLSTGYALYLVRGQSNYLPQTELAQKFNSWGIALFWSQLLANILWSNLYFVQRKINLSLVDIVVLWLLSVATMICFFLTSTLAGTLMVPYVIWASYATVLTYSVRNLNPNFKEKTPCD